jgi:hypothetical protein
MIQLAAARAAAAQRPPASRPDGRLAARPRLAALLVFSGACMVAEVLLTRFSEDSNGSRGLWILVGAFLLWRIYRSGSYPAWAISGVMAFMGAAIFSLGIAAGWWQATMCALYLGQGLPLLTRTVRYHVR